MKKIVAVLLLVFSSGNLDFCKGEAGLLLVAPSARLKCGESLSIAGVAPSVLLVNPAALVGLTEVKEKFYLEATVAPGFAGDDVYYYGGFSGYLKNLTSDYFVIKRYALMVGHYNGGKLEFYDQWGYPSVISSAQSDYVVSFGLSGVVKNNPSLRLGLAVKIYSSTLLESFSTTSVALDIGGIYKDKKEPYFVAVALKNSGLPIKYKYTEEGLPLTFSVMGGVVKDDYILGVNIPYNLRDNDRPITPELSGEVILSEIFSGRTRYKLNSAVEGLVVGFGVHIHTKGHKILFDYAYALNRLFENTHTITLSFVPLL